MVNRLHPKSRYDNENAALKYRALLYFRQSVIARWLPQGNAVFPCQRFHVPLTDHIGVSVKSGKARYKNLQHCKRLWVCPVCASWHAKTRRRQMERAIQAMRAKGYALAFITYTVQHDRDDSLATVRDRVLGAHKAMHSGKAWQTVERAYEWSGSIKAVECLYGVNGWHFHLHELAFVADDYDADRFESMLADRWDNCVRAQGGAQLPGIGLDVTPADIAAKNYVSKWGIVPELTASNAKRGKWGNVQPFQLPDVLLTTPGAAAVNQATFREFAREMHGVKQLWASPSVRGYMAEPPQTHENGHALNGELLRVSLDQWRAIWQHGLRVAALRAAEDGTLQSLLDTLTV